VHLKNFELLIKRVEKLVEQYDKVRNEKERLASQVSVQDKQSLNTKKELEKTIKQRDMVRQRLTSLIDKIDAMDAS